MARFLYYGCSGKDVKALQYWLNFIAAKQGSYLATLNLSSSFDGATFRRVLEFQWKSGMETKDGIVGAKTRAAIAAAAGIALATDGALPPAPGSDGQSRPADGYDSEYHPRHYDY